MSTEQSEANPWMAVGMSSLAGSATIIGGLAVFYVNKFQPLPFAFCLGLSSGVMVYVSFVEVFPESVEHFYESFQSLYPDNTDSRNHANAYTATVLFTFLGWFIATWLCWILDAVMEKFELIGKANFDDDGVLLRKDEELIKSASSTIEESKDEVTIPLPDHRFDYCLKWIRAKLLEVDPSDQNLVDAAEDRFRQSQSNFLRIGVFTAVVLALHNFPEGMGTFISYMSNPRFGYEMALAIGIHNIPEGLSVAIPVYFGTGSRFKALFMCSVSGVAEPLGAFLGWLIISRGQDKRIFGALLSCVAGIMLNVAIRELLVEAIRIDPVTRVTIHSFILGMAIMACSVIMFQYI